MKIILWIFFFKNASSNIRLSKEQDQINVYKNFKIKEKISEGKYWRRE